MTVDLRNTVIRNSLVQTGLRLTSDYGQRLNVEKSWIFILSKMDEIVDQNELGFVPDNISFSEYFS